MTLERDDAAKCYRFSTAKRNLFTVVTLSFFAMAVLSVYFFYFDGPVKATRVYAAIIIGGFWFAWTLLGSYLFALSYRYRLRISPSAIQQVGLFSEHIAIVSQIDEVKWRIPPSGGSIRLRGSFGVIKVGFGSFTPSDREELIAFFRSAIDEVRQISRKEFDAYYFPDASEKLKRDEASRRGLRFNAAVFLLMSLGMLTAWFLTGQFGPIFGVAVNLAASIYFWNASRRSPAPEAS